MIWTAITYNTSQEKIECKVVYDAPIDSDKAYGVIAADTNGIVLSIIKGNHKCSSYVPDLNLTLTRSEYRREF